MKVFKEKKQNTGETVHILDKINFQAKMVIHMIKKSIQHEDVVLVNVLVLNIGAPKYGKQKLTDFKGEFDSNKIGETLIPH